MNGHLKRVDKFALIYSKALTTLRRYENITEPSSVEENTTEVFQNKCYISNMF